MNPLVDSGARPVIAHRGDSAFAPENTFLSFDRAIAKGADALEFDVRLTSDGVPVIVHDVTVDRTTDGTGPVASFSLAALRALDAGARFVSRDAARRPYRGESLRVPTLEEMLERYRDIPFLIEVKIPEAVEPTRRMLERFGAVPRTMVDSTVDAAVAPFRGGALATGASMRDVIRLLPRALLHARAKHLPYEALCIPRWFNGVRVPLKRLAACARGAGVVTHVWTVNDPRIGQALWSAGVQGLITDDPAAMLALRARLGVPSPARRVPSLRSEGI